MNDQNIVQENIQQSVTEEVQMNVMNFFCSDSRLMPIGHFSADDYAATLSQDEAKWQDLIVSKVMLMNEWGSLYLAKPHQELGRTGPVCPFVPLSIKKHRFLITHFLCHEDTSKEAIQSLLLEYKKTFQLFDTQPHPLSTYNSIMIVFVCEDKLTSHVIELIKQVQIYLKPNFIQDNTMIGQFFEGCEIPGIHNKDFKPFEAPVSSLAIRKLMPQDIVFVTDTKENMRLYIQRFNIDSSDSLFALLKSVCLDKNKNVLEHAQAVLNQLEKSYDYEPI